MWSRVILASCETSLFSSIFSCQIKISMMSVASQDKQTNSMPPIQSIMLESTAGTKYPPMIGKEHNINYEPMDLQLNARNSYV